MNYLNELWRYSIRKIDSFSLFLGLAFANFAWGIQPKWSQGRYLIENGLWSSPFYFTTILFCYVLIGILIYRLIKIHLILKEISLPQSEAKK